MATQNTELKKYLDQHKEHLKGIYFVDKKTADNLKITVKDSVPIPLQFKNLVEDLLNLTTERNEILSPSSSPDTIPKILKFMPLEPIFTRSGNEFKITDGISFIDNSELIINTSPFGEFSFGEKRNGVNIKKKRFTIDFNSDIAVEQILQSKDFILVKTNIKGNFFIVVHTEEPDIFSLKIFDCPSQ
jgi:hypothetical protein